MLVHKLRAVTMIVAGCLVWTGVSIGSNSIAAAETAVSEDAIASADSTPSVEPTAVAPVRSYERVRVEDDDLRLLSGSGWKTVWAGRSSGRSHLISRREGAWVKVSFEGTSAALVTRRAPGRGQAAIYLDGAKVATINLDAETAEARKVLWRSSVLPDGLHTVRVVAADGSSAPIVVDAIDVVGSPVRPKLPGTKIESGNVHVARWGAWKRLSNGSSFSSVSWRSSTRGATVTYRFTGTWFTWIGRKSPTSGRAEVIVDGRKVATVTQYLSSTKYRRATFAMSGLADKTHTVTVRVLGSPSTGSGKSVDVDAFLVGGTIRQAYAPDPFDYPWSSYILIDKSDFRLYLIRDGWLIKSYPVAHGRSSMPTPSRVWRVGAKYYTSPTSVYGPRKMRLYQRVRSSSGSYYYVQTRYLIHGTDEPWVIGTLASHGCIRMYNSNVLDLFPRVPLYTMVVTRD